MRCGNGVHSLKIVDRRERIRYVVRSHSHLASSLCSTVCDTRATPPAQLQLPTRRGMGMAVTGLLAAAATIAAQGASPSAAQVLSHVTRSNATNH
jgi:hypothetical protein